MMARAGAGQIIAIETNVRAFLKCLIVKNALKFDTDFWLGDFREYLANTTDSYDFVLASGVLYHMTDPVRLLADIARLAPAVGLWTHYYDRDLIDSHPHLAKRFSREPRVDWFREREVVTFEQRYSHARGSPWFRGGSAEVSYWLTKESLLAVLEAVGFDYVIHDEKKDHPNGPSLLIYACASPPSST
jgi:SAM-dependent methyltransferase